MLLTIATLYFVGKVRSHKHGGASKRSSSEFIAANKELLVSLVEKLYARWAAK